MKVQRRRAACGLITLVSAICASCASAEDTVDSTVPATVVTSTSTPVTTTQAPPPPMFGDMPSPCGPARGGDIITIADGQNGSSPLALGVATDRHSDGTSSAASEILDAARAFAQWCNAQGGLRGLPIEIVELDAQIANVPLAMEQACARVFAMVGGGWIYDEQMYPRFHECGMVSFPAFTTSAAARMANGKVQAIPEPIDSESSGWLEWIASEYSASIDAIAIVHPDLPPLAAVAFRLSTTMQTIGGFGDPVLVPFPNTPPADWTPVIDDLRDAGVRAVAFLGDASQLIDFETALRADTFLPDVVFGESNLMDADVIAAAPPADFSRLRIRAMHPPLSRSEASAGVASYLEMMTSLEPAGRIGSLGLRSTSALLLFMTAANDCLDTNGNVLERECLLARAKNTTSWTAGGLHAPTNPSANSAVVCFSVVGVEAGSWTRVFPVPGSAEDDGNGSSCDEEGIIEIPGDFGDSSAGFDSSRPN